MRACRWCRTFSRFGKDITQADEISDKMDINQEVLITLVQERPVIWDKTIEGYKNKRLKFDCWKEIFVQLNPAFEDLSGEEKNTFGQHVMKKWTNMKDNWMKCHKKMGEYKSGAGAHKIRKYNFYDQMLFLSKIVEHRKTDPSMDEHVNSSGINNENAEPNPSRSQNGKASEAPKAKQKKKNNQLSEVDIKFMKFMDVTAQEEKSRSMNFFRGISDSVDKFTDENMIDFQFQVISIIKSIQERENNRYIAAPRNQWDHGQQGYQSGTTPANSQFSVYGHSTAARSGFGINGQEYDFGHSSGLEPIPNRPESQASAQSVNTESTSANSQASTEEFDFSSAFREHL
ncbi:unnamed protein product [Acanthoscelides obtectus]|uniref:MADF domain-containing protein n=1 Tax=Acanthoscelides obtectus TaxID=200917 RepID=A0A9P0PBU8_ACAOB|nr:unnamed protein product [Acanthoscelides obtectus]CAK1641663.1 hypothetical protein AOBTE_LOCUS12541 [Acanthoscelides obtectus]